MKSGILMLAAVASCAASANAELIFGVTNTQTLVRWDSSAPSTILGGAAISGMMANEVVRSIDFRPSNGKLYAIGSFGNIYTLNLNTGAASFVSQISTPLNGSSFGMDFNPVVDRLRVITDADQNLRINVDTGARTRRRSRTSRAIELRAQRERRACRVHELVRGRDLDDTVRARHGAGHPRDSEPAECRRTHEPWRDRREPDRRRAFDISGTTGRAYVTVLDTARSQSTFWSLDLSTGAGTFLGDMGMIGAERSSPRCR